MKTSLPSQCHRIALSIWVSKFQTIDSLLLIIAFFRLQLKITRKVRVTDIYYQDVEADSYFTFTEEILGCLQFVTNYRDRYGHGPNFFEGTLEDAVKAACLTKSAKDVSLLVWSRDRDANRFPISEKTSRNLFASRPECLIECVLWAAVEQREYHQATEWQLCHLRLGSNLRKQQEFVSCTKVHLCVETNTSFFKIFVVTDCLCHRLSVHSNP